MYGYYSLEQLSVIEKKLVSLRKDMGIDTYLTGISGGVRYAPVVRYNKLYMYIAPEDIQEAIQYLELKEVTSGANVILCPLDQDTYIKDALCSMVKIFCKSILFEILINDIIVFMKEGLLMMSDENLLDVMKERGVEI